MRFPTIYRWTLALATLFGALSQGGCAIDDDRDICCYNTLMEFSYVPYGIEELTTYIHSFRHFVFDDQGRFVCEILHGKDLRRQRFDLPEGDYTMISLGNAEQQLAFDASDHTLRSLEMELAQRTASGKYLNADELYWGICPMHVVKGNDNRFVTRMNNIHCHLHVKVVWYNMPEEVGDYRLELSGVPVGYSLNPESCYRVDDKILPAINGNLETYVRRTPLKAQELQAEFITMRYTDDTLPVFRLWFGEQAVTEPIDLGRAFETWGWRPQATAVQEYRIQLTIYSNGTVEVRPWIDADVEDWQNGGTFS